MSKELPPDPDQTPATEGLFTDSAVTSPMLPAGEFDGAPAAEVPIIDVTKGGKKLKRVVLEDGHVYTGETELDLLEAAVKGKNEANKAIRQRDQEIQELRQRLTVAPQPAPAPAVAAPAEAFDGEKYLEMLGKDPLGAVKYANSYVGGQTVADPRVEYAYNAAKKLEEQNLVMEFNTRNPDYIGTPENNQMLAGILQQRGLPVNLVNLEWGLTEMKRHGQIANTPAGVEYEDVQFGAQRPPQPPPVRRGPGVPPPPPASNSEQTSAPTNVEQMPLAKLRELINRGGR